MGIVFAMLAGKDVNKTLENKSQKIESEAPTVVQKTVYVQQQSVRNQMRIGNIVPEFIKVGIRIFAGLLILASVIRWIGL